MNVKHILLFTICVALSKGLGLLPPGDEEEDRFYYRQSVIDHLMPKKRHKTGLYDDKAGNVFIRLMVHPGKKRTSVFVEDVRRIGVNVETPVKGGEANMAVVVCFAKILGVPMESLEVITGLQSTRKILKLSRGFLPLKDALGKIVDKCMDTNTQCISN